jgi:outer membrane lipoprotein-sorting protein
MPDALFVSIANLSGLGKLIEGYDGKTGWSLDPIQGYREKSGEELSRAKLIGRFYRDQELDSSYTKLEFTGTEKVDGSDAYVIKASNAGMAPDVLYFDAATGLLVRMDSVIVSPQGRIQTTSLFSDYREVDGVKSPFRFVTKLPQYDMVITITEIKQNTTIDPKIFAPRQK